MIIVKSLGGLGNQMFQLAFYISLKHKNKNVKLDIIGFETYQLHNGYELERIFNINNVNYACVNDIRKFNETNVPIFLKRVVRILKNLFGKNKYIIERIRSFDNKYYEMENCYLEGYWQSEKYFENVKNEIREIFTFPEIVDEHNSQILKKIKATESIGIHVRRGDYIDHPYFVGICTEVYYQKAINYLLSRVQNPHLYFFSNDIDWCRESFKFSIPTYFIDWNKKDNSYIDMQLMAQCKHNIIANSTFSWWGAWLNSNPDKIVIAPTKIINGDNDVIDLIPKSWVKIDG